MIHITASLAGPAIAAIAMREAGALARRLLAYRHQRHLIEMASKPGSPLCSFDIAGIDQIIIHGTAIPNCPDEN